MFKAMAFGLFFDFRMQMTYGFITLKLMYGWYD